MSVWVYGEGRRGDGVYDLSFVVKQQVFLGSILQEETGRHFSGTVIAMSWSKKRSIFG